MYLGNLHATKRTTRLLLGSCLFAILLLLCSCGSAQSSAGETSSPTPTASAVSPTPVQTTKPNQAAPTLSNPGPAVLGADSNAFIAKYGNPDNSSPGNPDSGGKEYDFHRYPNTGVYFLSVITCCLYKSPSFYHTRANSIIVNPAPNQLWSLSEAKSECLVFAPSDSHFQQEIKRTGPSGDLIDSHVYTSRSLKNALPSNEFVDIDINPLPPGTFAITYSYLGNQVAFCDVTVGNGPRT